MLNSVPEHLMLNTRYLIPLILEICLIRYNNLMACCSPSLFLYSYSHHHMLFWQVDRKVPCPTRHLKKGSTVASLSQRSGLMGRTTLSGCLWWVPHKSSQMILIHVSWLCQSEILVSQAVVIRCIQNINMMKNVWVCYADWQLWMPGFWGYCGIEFLFRACRWMFQCEVWNKMHCSSEQPSHDAATNSEFSLFSMGTLMEACNANWLFYINIFHMLSCHPTLAVHIFHKLCAYTQLHLCCSRWEISLLDRGVELQNDAAEAVITYFWCSFWV